MTREECGAGAKVAPMQAAAIRLRSSPRPTAAACCRSLPGAGSRHRLQRRHEDVEVVQEAERLLRGLQRPQRPHHAREAGLCRDLQHVAQLLDGDANLVQWLGVIGRRPCARCGRAGPVRVPTSRRVSPSRQDSSGDTARAEANASSARSRSRRGPGPSALRERAHRRPALVVRGTPARPRRGARRPVLRTATRRPSPAPRRVRGPARGHA